MMKEQLQKIPCDREPDRKSLDRARKLIRALIDEDTSGELHALLCDWFASGADDGAVEQAFVEYALENMHPNRKPDYAELRNFAELARKLGIPEVGVMRMAYRRRSRLLYGKIAARVAAVLIPAVILLGTGYFAGWYRNAGDESGADVRVAENTVPDMEPVAELPEEEAADATVWKAAVKQPAPSVTEQADTDILIVETGEGMQKDVILADNSKVRLNSNSRITYRKNFVEDRRVTLEGNAYFEVGKDGGRPFVVKTENIEVRVLGTKFDVKEYPGETTSEVALTEGSVRVAAGQRSAVLNPGQKLTCYHDSKDMKITDIETGGDWHREVLTIEGKTLGEIFDRVSEYYGTNIIYDPELLGNDLFDATMGPKISIEQILHGLAVTSDGFTFRKNDENEIYIETANP